MVLYFDGTLLWRKRGEEGRGNDYEVTILRSLCMDNFLGERVLFWA
jgi:hypothetical protein